MKYLVLSALCAVVSSASAECAEISVFGWNGNTGRREVARVADSVHDLYGIIDVRVSAIESFSESAKEQDVHLENRFEFLGESGGLVMWNPKKLKVIDSPPDQSRTQLATKFEDRDSGAQFWFVLVDCDRRPDVSHRQVESLGQWLSRQELPVLVVGHIGFDADLNQFLVKPESEPNHPNFGAFTTHGLHWIRPPRLYELPSGVETLDYLTFANASFNSWSPIASVTRLATDHPPTKVVFRPTAESTSLQQDR